MVLRPQRLVSYDLGLHYTRDRVKDRSRVHLSSWEYDLTFDDARLLTERIDMPLLVNLHVLPGLAQKAGVQPSLLLSAKMKYHMTGSMVDFSNLVGKAYLAEELAQMPRMAVDEDTSEGMKSQMRNLDVSVPVGLSYEWQLRVAQHRGGRPLPLRADAHRQGPGRAPPLPAAHAGLPLRAVTAQRENDRMPQDGEASPFPLQLEGGLRRNSPRRKPPPVGGRRGPTVIIV